MTKENFHNYHSQKLIEALTSLMENRPVDRQGVDYLKHTLTYIPWNLDIADSWSELLKAMDGQLRQILDGDQYYDELKAYVNEFDQPEQKFEILDLMVRYSFQNNRFEPALEMVNDQIELASTNNNHILQNRAYNTKGVLYHVLGQLDKAEDWYSKAYDILKHLNVEENVQLADRTIYALANLYQHYVADFQKALKFYKEGLDLAEKAENPERKTFFLDHMGMAEYWLGDYEQALKYHERASLLLSKHERDINLLFHKVQQSMALSKIGNYERVGEDLFEVIDLKKKNSDSFSNCWYLLLLSEYSYNKPNNFEDLGPKFETELQISLDPLELAIKAKEIGVQSNHVPSLVNANLYIARYAMEKNTEEAMTALSEAKHLSIQNNRNREIQSVKETINSMGLDYESL